MFGTQPWPCSTYSNAEYRHQKKALPIIFNNIKNTHDSTLLEYCGTLQYHLSSLHACLFDTLTLHTLAYPMISNQLFFCQTTKIALCIQNVYFL
jgi:hypothetical protein